MSEIEKLLRLLQAVPVLHVDEAAARARGDRAALDYAGAVRRWQEEASRALAEMDEPAAERPSAFERILLAADRARVPPAAPNLSA